jgi:hypothetical protein
MSPRSLSLERNLTNCQWEHFQEADLSGISLSLPEAIAGGKRIYEHLSEPGRPGPLSQRNSLELLFSGRAGDFPALLIYVRRTSEQLRNSYTGLSSCDEH